MERVLKNILPDFAFEHPTSIAGYDFQHLDAMLDRLGSVINELEEKMDHLQSKKVRGKHKRTPTIKK